MQSSLLHEQAILPHRIERIRTRLAFFCTLTVIFSYFSVWDCVVSAPCVRHPHPPIAWRGQGTCCFCAGESFIMTCFFNRRHAAKPQELTMNMLSKFSIAALTAATIALPVAAADASADAAKCAAKCAPAKVEKKHKAKKADKCAAKCAPKCAAAAPKCAAKCAPKCAAKCAAKK